MPYFHFSPVYQGDYGNNASNVTDGCPNGVRWMWSVFGNCATTTREEASTYVGLLSVLVWMVVGIPQIIKNFRNLEGMAGVSFFLLFQWTVGDSTNLIGAFLTHQLKPQIYIAVYFVINDAVLLAQYLAFIIKKRRRQKTHDRDRDGKHGSGPQLILCLMGVLSLSQLFCGPSWSSASSPAGTQEIAYSGRLSRTLLSAQAESDQVLIFQPEEGLQDLGYSGSTSLPNVHSGNASFWNNTTNIIGYTIGVISSIFYLGSRIAQICKNIKKKSTEGLAIMTFMFAVLGNITYGTQIVLQSCEPEFILEHTPWLVGSFGVIGLDCTLLGQFYYYRHTEDEERKSLLDHEYLINGDGEAVEIVP